MHMQWRSFSYIIIGVREGKYKVLVHMIGVFKMVTKRNSKPRLNEAWLIRSQSNEKHQPGVARRERWPSTYGHRVFHGQYKGKHSLLTYNHQIIFCHPNRRRLTPGVRTASAGSTSPFLKRLTYFPNTCTDWDSGMVVVFVAATEWGLGGYWLIEL